MSSLADLVRMLAQARADLARIDTELKARREEWEKRWEQESGDLIVEHGNLQMVVSELEREVREKAVEVARETGDRRRPRV